eukprot:4759382-Amphidinium_carterae.1
MMGLPLLSTARCPFLSAGDSLKASKVEIHDLMTLRILPEEDHGTAGSPQCLHHEMQECTRREKGHEQRKI